MFGFHFTKVYGCLECPRWFRSFWRYKHHAGGTHSTVMEGAA